MLTVTYFRYNENRKTMENLSPKYIKDDFPGINMTVNAAVFKDGAYPWVVWPSLPVGFCEIAIDIFSILSVSAVQNKSCLTVR